VFFGPDTYRFARAIKAGLRERTAPIANAVDIGCGAGPGGILVAKHAPAARVLMTDINDAALRLARVNAALAGTTNAIAHRSDILADVDGAFDLIASNPPYLNDALQRAYRHGGGHFGADLSLRILDAALPRLAPAGSLILYTGTAIVAGRDLFRESALPRLTAGDLAWIYEEIDPDVFGEELEAPAYRAADRIAAVVLNVRKRS
jgi:methylase of polypeptide subunit release factors